MNKHGQPRDSGLQNVSEPFQGPSLGTTNGHIDGYPHPAPKADMNAFQLVQLAIQPPDSSLIGTDTSFWNVSLLNFVEAKVADL